MRRSVQHVSADELIVRLRKIEGQVRGLQRMIRDDERPVDILTQVASARAALGAVALGVVDGEVRRATGDGGSAPAAGVDELLTSIALVAHQ